MTDCNETTCRFQAGSRINGQMKFNLVEKADKLGSRLTLQTPAALETAMESGNICPNTSPQCPLLAGIPYTYSFSAIVPNKPSFNYQPMYLELLNGTTRILCFKWYIRISEIDEPPA
ncbi:hypothetical protein CSKR_113105 [Clonorchis sinensis]|uniref:MD-2-related lipid-recognition domain-containing protein n=1 Tax=Clonorchis sinensis TaxID=79923 RepID=A0A419Q9Q8_CLOSI|nr:hypothetical protein CSKR_113105 [Clonorchis sinensis]